MTRKSLGWWKMKVKNLHRNCVIWSSTFFCKYFFTSSNCVHDDGTFDLKHVHKSFDCTTFMGTWTHTRTRSRKSERTWSKSNVTQICWTVNSNCNCCLFVMFKTYRFRPFVFHRMSFERMSRLNSTVPIKFELKHHIKRMGRKIRVSIWDDVGSLYKYTKML